ncbi:unnamed protein product [Rotaria socialis]|uniref:SKP1 component POZ domain-containing protein n=2 Tax=Rotaria socialis TaxID=392032 RepID=A0A821BH52_9BILA|nr:unnamed protein product [Rotaria socialis]
MTGHKIKLQSSDGDTFDVEVEIAKQSIKEIYLFDDKIFSTGDETQLSENKVYLNDPPPPPEDDENREKNTTDISSWDQDFLKVDQGTLFELILVLPF